MEKKKPGRPAGAKTAVKETVPETKAAEAAAAVEVKETAGGKAAETKETEAAVKAEAVEKKDQAEKEVAKMKKTTRTAKKTKAAQEELKPEIILQFQGNESAVGEAVEKAKAQFVSEGHRMSSIKTLQLYLKPEESAAYYVINQKFAGNVDLF